MKKKLAIILFSILLVMLSVMPVMAEDWVEGGYYTVTFPIESSGGVYNTSIAYRNCEYYSMDLQIDDDIEAWTDKSSIMFFSDDEVTGIVQITIQAINPGEDASVSLSTGDIETHAVICSEHEYGDPVIIEATCTTNGSRERTCLKCGYVDTEIIKAPGHDYRNPVVVTEATCEEDGLRRGTCTVCGATIDEAIPATGHKLGPYKEGSKGDCQHHATRVAICETCGKEVTEETDKYGEHQFDNPVLVQEATISKAEIYEGKCKVCGETTKQVGSCYDEDISTGIIVTCSEGTFEEGSELKVSVVNAEDSFYELATNSLADISDEFILYDLKVLKDNMEVTPKGKVGVSFPIPSGFGKKIGLYSISKEGNIMEIDGITSFDGATYMVDLTELSSFAICKLSNTNGKNIIIPDNMKIYIGIALVLIILLIILTKKRNAKRRRAKKEEKKKRIEAQEEAVENAVEEVVEEDLYIPNEVESVASDMRRDYVPGSYSDHIREEYKEEEDTYVEKVYEPIKGEELKNTLSYSPIKEEVKIESVPEKEPEIVREEPNTGGEETLEEMVRKFNRLKKREKNK